MTRLLIFILFLLIFSFTIQAQAIVHLSAVDEVTSDIAFVVLEKAYERLGVKLEMQYLPPERGLFASNIGEYDGEVNRIWGLNKDYPNLVRIEVPVNILEVSFLTCDSSIATGGWEIFSNYKTGYVIGIKVASNNIYANTLFKASSMEQLYNMLRDNRIDIVAVSYVGGLKELCKENNVDLYLHKLTIPPIPTYHYLNKKYESLIPLIEKELNRMQKNGEIEKIRQDYIRDHLCQDNKN